MAKTPSRTPWCLAQSHGQRANHRSYQDGGVINEYVADPYHETRRKLAAEMVREADLDGRPVLELGCGSKSMLTPYHLPARLVLADLAVGALTRACHDAAVSGEPALATAALPVCLDVTRSLPFRSGSFGAVVMGDLIEHVYDPVALLVECRRVLGSSGLLILTTPNLAGLQDRAGFLFGRAPRQVNPLHPYLWLHIRPFTASLLCQALRHAGFDLLRVRSNYVGWQLPGGRWIVSRLLARILPQLGGSLIFSARRR